MKNRTIVVILLLLVLTAVAVEQYWRMFRCNIQTNSGTIEYVYIYPHYNIDSVIVAISQVAELQSSANFKLHSKLLRYDNPKIGCYAINPQEGDVSLIRRLRAGEQSPVSVTINRIRTRGQLAQKLSEQLLLDSAAIADRLSDETYMSRFGLNQNTAVCMFLPDTYQMYWTISADQLFEKMFKQYKSFWNASRQEKAKRIGLTPVEVATIASIAEEETNKDFEYPIIAGLYINRLKKGIKMQACPTIKFAWQDFTLRRILNKHLEIDSPYNTYKYAGLPPGPIRAPRASTIDAVLNYTPSNYLYMCASAEFNGTHHFSSTFSEHSRYAKIYQQELNKRNIK